MTLLPARRPAGWVFAELARAWGPLLSATMVRRSLITDFGGFCPGLEAAEDRDLLLGIALRTPFAENPEALVIRHEHPEPRLHQDRERRLRSMQLIDRRWRGEVARRGLRAYGYWVRHWVMPPELGAMFERAEREGRVAAIPALRSLVSRLPWSADGATRAAILLLIGPRAYVRIRAWMLMPPARLGRRNLPGRA
jgi:hypothetical protein